MQRFVLCALLFAAAASCRTTPELSALEPLAVGAALEVEYESSVAYAGDFTAAEEPWSGLAEPAPGSHAIDVLVEIVSLPRAAAERLFDGAPRELGGWRVERQGAETRLAELVDSGIAESVADSRMCVFAGQSAFISVLNQIAFISSFEVEKSADTLIADPVVGVLQDGILACLRPTRATDGTLSLALELSMTDVELPIQDAEVRIPGSVHPVTLQLPIASRQVLRTTFGLTPGECAVLSGLAPADPGRRLLAFVTAEPLVPGAAPTPSRSAAP
jgi:hypothetical protein